MRHIRKWVVGIGIVFLASVIILASTGAWLVIRPWPQISGTIQAHGLQAQVEVLRDKWGVPNIYAQNEHDLLFAQGYVHAQDRLWQMEMIRRLASGTLSEVIGEPTLSTDRTMRILGLRRAAEQSWPKLNEESRTLLEAYAEGVNAYIDTHRDRLPLEYAILGFSPTVWTPIDSMTEGNYLAENMSFNPSDELLRAEMIAKVGATMTGQFFKPDKNMPFIVPDGVDDYRWLQNTSAKQTIVTKWLGMSSQMIWGSNNWVVQGSRTATGKALLANDTHLGLQMPSVWYENGLHSGRFNSTGITVPGVPLVIFGHNQNIAWGGTNLCPDVQDYYIEKLNDRKNPTQYEFMGKWHDLKVIPETINVKNAQPVSLLVLFTGHGPLTNLANDKEEPMAMRWSIDGGGSLVFNAIVQLNLANNWKEFHAALRDWDMLSQNFVYADMDGNIGYQAAGRIPIRVPQHEGVLPMPGWTGEYEWQGYIPYEELPAFLNPPSGFIASANNQITPNDYPYTLSYKYVLAYRAIRINILLSPSRKFTSADMRAVQADTYSLSAEALRPFLLAAVKPENDLQSKALEQLKTWDLYLETDRVGASIFETWYLYMMRDTLSDELGNDLAGWYTVWFQNGETNLLELMADPNAAWFDDVSTTQRETRDEIVQRSFADAVKWLSEHYGEAPGQWQWGRMHTTTFIDAPLGRSGIPFLESIVNGGPVASAGGRDTVNQTLADWPNPTFGVVHGTSQRMIMDLSNWDLMLAINSTGQSGHILHPNSKDQISMWQKVEYHPVPFTRTAVEKNTEATLTLIP